MPWVRIDDHFDEHPKTVELSGDAVKAFIFTLCYCNRNLTDGFIPRAVGRRYPSKAVAALEASGLWEPTDKGWMVHDYLDYQPSKQQVEDERAKKQAAGQAGGKASAQARAEAAAQAKSKPVPKPNPVPIKDAAAAAAVVTPERGVGGTRRPGMNRVDRDFKSILDGMPAEVLDRLQQPSIGERFDAQS